ncbi:DUF3570 domain-containing protein [Pendulispora rubella]|uniref:DUF3570 domain-containing protein n=1 Tax=Pendulispora rubella TaxID=2741070 RepID=A0ABZ2LCC2_9BACT
MFPRVRYVLALVICLVAGPAYAAPDDAATESFVQDVLTNEYSSTKYADAKKKLLVQLEKCRRPNRCSGGVKAQIYVALGMIASQIGMVDEAKNHFANALSEDTNARLPDRGGTTPAMKTQFTDAKSKNAGPTQVAPQDPPTEGGGGGSGDAPAPPVSVAPGGKIPGWENNEAFQLASAGLKADQAGNHDECIENDKKSLELEDKARTRLHLASCENKAGKLLDALKNAQKALKMGIEQKDAGVMRAARTRVQDLIPKIPHVTFEPPSGVSDLQVRFDDREVKGDLTKKFSVDPGKHQVHAEGKGNGNSLVYDEEINVKEGETYPVKLTLTSKAPEFLTQGQLSCMTSAKNQEEVLKCLPSNAKNLVAKVGLEMSAYTDTLNVHVMSPGITAAVISPTAGWNVGGSFLADFVTAASPDIVSTASGHFVERRYGGSLGGGYKPGKFGAQGNAGISSSPDYLSISGGIAITGDFNDKLITPRISYSHSDETIGRNDSPFANVPGNHLGDKRKLFVNAFEAGCTFVLSPTSVLVLGASLDTERGDQSKIYRYVPMFSPSVASKVTPGLPANLVNANRLAYRPQEQLPNERDRYAGALRFVHRFTTATLRLEERLYYDTWSIKATTTDLRYMQDIGKHLRVWPHIRFHAQTGANFYRLAYAAATKDDGTIVIPTYRTGNRELSPLMSATVGFGARIALGETEATTQYALTVTGDYMYTYYFNSLYTVSRQAFYASLGFEVEFQ